MSVIDAAEALCGLSYSATRDAYVSALYPHDERGSALSQASGQSSCGLVCEAILRTLGIDSGLPYERSWKAPITRLPAVAWQREEAKRRGAWVDARVWGPERQLPIAGSMIEVGGDSAAWGDPGVYSGPHVETIVGGEKFDVEAIAGGQLDAGNVNRRSGAAQLTAIKRVFRRFDERGSQLWLVDPETRKGRRVSGWIDTSLL